MWYLAGFVFALALGVMGCGDDACTAPLNAFWLCSDGCPTYEEAAATPTASTGTCLDLQYVTIGGLSAKALFFDMSGTLVGVEVTRDDGSLCGGNSYIKSYGRVPSCGAHECGRFWC